MEIIKQTFRTIGRIKNSVFLKASREVMKSGNTEEFSE